MTVLSALALDVVHVPSRQANTQDRTIILLKIAKETCTREVCLSVGRRTGRFEGWACFTSPPDGMSI